jgi:hypothetical protein
VGLDGKRLDRPDCARWDGLSASVVNRQFASLERLEYQNRSGDDRQSAPWRSRVERLDQIAPFVAKMRIAEGVYQGCISDCSGF